MVLVGSLCVVSVVLVGFLWVVSAVLVFCCG